MFHLCQNGTNLFHVCPACPTAGGAGQKGVCVGHFDLFQLKLIKPKIVIRLVYFELDLPRCHDGVGIVVDLIKFLVERSGHKRTT